MGKSVSTEIVSSYQQLGMEIIGLNHCQNVAFDNQKSLDFLRGNGPTWEIFRYDEQQSDMPENCINPLVKRDLANLMIEQVKTAR